MNTVEKLNTGIGMVSSQPIQKTHVEAEIDHLNGATMGTLKTLEELEQRLSRVLRQRPEEADNCKNPPDEVLVQHADAIRSIRKQVENMTNRLQSIISRLEA